ncbi:hypothetical protein [Microcella sp.]|uniref:hypothetical protein n=1 Tax=Microcella sp. TaxID=1913979 RepID=UPI00391DAD9F
MSRTTLRVSSLLVLSSVVALAGAGTASALGGATDTRTSISVDCAIGEGSNDNQVILPGESLTITLLNCGDWLVTDLAGLNAIDVPAEASDINSFVVPSGSPTYTMSVDDEVDLELTFEADDIDIDVSIAVAGDAPSGALLATNRVAMPIEIDDFSIGLDALGTDVTLGGDAECTMEAGYHPYRTLPIIISESGDFTFRVIDVEPVDEDLQWGQPYYPSQDFFLAVYTAFDPTEPESGLVSCNDDRPVDDVSFVNDGVTYISDDQAPEFVATLAPGAYTLVLTTYRSTSSDDWAAGEFSEWSGVSDLTWAPIEMSALFELWGPTGSLAIGEPDEPELADTGIEPSDAMAISAGAALLIAFGLALLVARRSLSRTR